MVRIASTSQDADVWGFGWPDLWQGSWDWLILSPLQYKPFYASVMWTGVHVIKHVVDSSGSYFVNGLNQDSLTNNLFSSPSLVVES